MSTFCTAINCMDGRVQLPVIEYLKKRFITTYVDVVSEPGPNGVLSRQDNPHQMESIFARVEISVKKHGSSSIAIVGHHDCAGNPGDEAKQVIDVQAAKDLIRERYPACTVVGLWVDENWEVSEVE